MDALASRRFSVQGLGLAEFIVLQELDNQSEGKMRRVDLADKLGLTASGITRMLLPMEKIGLVKRAADKNDARVSHVVIAASGKRILEESIERANMISDEIIASNQICIEELRDLLK